MSDSNTQVATNTQGSGDAQTVAGADVSGAGANPPASTSSDSATTSQQANDGQTAAGANPAASSEGDKGATGDDAATQGDKSAGAPDKYEFKAPDGVTFDDAVMTEFSTVAKELNLPQDAAQKVIDKLAPVIAKQNAEALATAMQTATADWVKATQTDKDIGGEKLNENLAVAKKALDRYGTPELRKLLGAFDSKANPMGTGLGNHPEIIRAFIKVGRAISEDKFVPGGTQPSKGERNAAKALYPNQPA